MANKKHVILLSLSFVITACEFIFPKYQRQLKDDFKIVVNKSETSIVNEKEQWDFNGDGFYLVELTFFSKETFKSLRQQRLFKRLPITEEIPVGNAYNYLKKATRGFYLIDIEDDDQRDFKIVVLDEETNHLFFYYQLY